MVRCKHILAAALLLAPVLLPTGAMAQEIGTVAFAEQRLQGTPPGSGTRRLDVGTRIFADETVASSDTGRGQLMFLDQTTLTLGPNTTIVLDTFVFDPTSGGGEIGIGLAEGTLRFIGGSLSRDTPATVTTPAATIGIRGSTGIVSYIDGEVAAVFIAGEQMCLSTGSGRPACTSRQGGVLTREGYVGRVSQSYLSQLVAQVNGGPVGGGGGGGGGAGGTGLGGSGLGLTPPAPGASGSTSGTQFDRGLFDNDMSLDQMMGALMPTPTLYSPPPGRCVFRADTRRIACR